MENKILIGFNNGDLYRVIEPSYDEKLLNILYSEKTKALELHFDTLGDLEDLINLKESIYNRFEYLSLHAPDLKGDIETEKILLKLRDVCQKMDIKNIVMHPHEVKNWDIFKDFQDIPLSIENMDENKPFGQNIEDLGPILDKHKFLGLTLDLQHCFVNDNSMKIADEFHEKYGDRIVEYHISGYNTEYLHYGLYYTKQDEIIKSLKKKNIPIIIESTLNSVDDLEKEVDYILDRL
ncbi:MAG TPA: hypothetical protein VJ892_04900 [Candidatus Absconditabacterales bacterium]|nr:hypothetical protein [Candidatus Absconditabacterales bacterium]